MREEDGSQVSWRDVRTMMIEMQRVWDCAVSIEMMPAPIDRAEMHLYWRVVFKRRRKGESRVWERAEGFYWPTVNYRTVPQGLVAAMYGLDRILDDEKGRAEQQAFL